jgi:hypothetical protein
MAGSLGQVVSSPAPMTPDAALTPVQQDLLESGFLPVKRRWRRTG